MLDFVNGRNNSNNIQDYLFTDEQPASGNNYYRLKQMDLDGQFEYSLIINLSANRKDQAIGEFSPNPASGQSVQLNYASQRNSKLHVSVINLSGTVVVQQQYEVATGANTLHFDCADLEPGIYKVGFYDEETIVYRRLIVTK